ncbi:hypothetical protein SNR37_001486 [Agarivorans aestuarii]|uniref:Methyl-accepting chemotaxis protein n=1 Tax=Agarivorans aestuarii TaxID=1563703 RepID=A0ABU7GAN0_9ALTE|nr:hypothetical protein [Agarivorans aestuarii]MEE1676159.1 hypothetical protein [Agarivorans aestuarii]
MNVTLDWVFWAICGGTTLVAALQVLVLVKSNSSKVLLEHKVQELQLSTEQGFGQTDKELENTSNSVNNKIDEVVNDTNKLIQNLHEQLIEAHIHQTSTLEKSISKQSNDLASLLTELSKSSSHQAEQLTLQINRFEADILEQINTQTTKLDKQQLQYFEQSQKSIKQLTASAQQQSQSLLSVIDKNQFENKQMHRATIEQLTSLVESLRCDNLVSLSNELAKHQDLNIETADFIKQLGDCKVTQITDKHSNQVTKLLYIDGVRRSSETYAGKQLKYQMTYSPQGQPEMGTEFDANGNAIFEYVYDEAGEINQRIEREFDANDVAVKQTETTY